MRKTNPEFLFNFITIMVIVGWTALFTIGYLVANP